MSDWIYKLSKAAAVTGVIEAAKMKIFEGLLSQEEAEVLDELIVMGIVKRTYEGGAGFMGCAKLEVVR